MNEDRVTSDNTSKGTPEAFEDRLNRCFSMVLHHPEVGRIIEIVKRVRRTTALSPRSEEKEGSDE